MIRSITLLAAILTYAPTLVAAESHLPYAHDLKHDAVVAKAAAIPIMVLFSRPGCPFCQRVRDDYLLPLQTDPAYQHKVMLREVDITSNTALTLFDGSTATASAFAAANKIYLVPTIMVFDAHGAAVGDAIVGLLGPDFYFGYIDSAISAGIEAMKKSPGTP
jgi:thioredoxin-related protein